MKYFFYIIEQDTGGNPPLIHTYLLTQGEQVDRIEQRLKHMIGEARIKHKVEVGSLFDVRNLTIIAADGFEYSIRAQSSEPIIGLQDESTELRLPLQNSGTITPRTDDLDPRQRTTPLILD